MWFRWGSCMIAISYRKDTIWLLSFYAHHMNFVPGWNPFNVQSNCITPLCSYMHLSQVMSRKTSGCSARVKRAYVSEWKKCRHLSTVVEPCLKRALHYKLQTHTHAAKDDNSKKKIPNFFQSLFLMFGTIWKNPPCQTDLAACWAWRRKRTYIFSFIQSLLYGWYVWVSALYTRQLRSAKSSIKSNNWLMS